MFFKRNSTARRPSLSTIDSVDSKRPVHSPPHFVDPEHTNNYVRPETRESLPDMASDKTAHGGDQNFPPPPSSDSSSWKQPRPMIVRVPTTETKYMKMLLHLDRIPRIYNILAGAFTWILLASFLIIPGTFTSFKNSDVYKNVENNDDKSSAIAKAILHSAQNIGLLWLSAIFCFIGGFGCLFLWFRWHKNYVWLVNKVFLPALLNSFAGLLTTIVNVYTAQKGVWSVTAKITAIVTGCLIAVAGGLFAAYNFWMLEKVRDDHEAAYYGGEREDKQ